MSLRDTIANAPDLERVIEPVPEWDVTLELRQFDLDRRTALTVASMTADRDADDNLTADSLADWYAQLLIAAAHDPDTGEPVFTESDAAMLRSKRGKTVDRLADIVLDLNGMKAEAVDQGKAGSSTTPTGGTGSD